MPAWREFEDEFEAQKVGYRWLRRAIGVLGIALPLALTGVCRGGGDGCVSQLSILGVGVPAEAVLAGAGGRLGPAARRRGRGRTSGAFVPGTGKPANECS